MSAAQDALRAILADPHGCRFCDSGKLRNPAKDHDPECGYALARAALSAPDGWVAVDERLPEGEEDVLVAWHKGRIDMLLPSSVAAVSRQQDGAPYVTHWQPLPAPPLDTEKP